MREGRTQGLVVGAGPVGLWTALLLAEAGIEVVIIDHENRTTARTYACALHSSTLGLLGRHGLAEPVVEEGHRVRKMAFYDGAERCAELDLSALGGEFPFVLILPQSSLERLLEERLRQKGVAVQWQHRFDGVAEEADSVAVTVEELTGTSTGYIVPHWETVVKNRAVIRAQFLIGADGQNSLLRHRLDIGFDEAKTPELFAAYEFVSDQPAGDEVRVVLDDSSTNVLWPLGGTESRWTFQIAHGEVSEDFPEKERRAARLANPNIDEKVRRFVEKVAKKRAPWFSAQVKEVTWCTEVSFHHRLARNYGRGRCWLVGDAAHQTGPVGVQSMNLGLLEGESLAGALKAAVDNDADDTALRTYEQQYKAIWRRLLALDGGLKPRLDTLPWVRQRAAHILPCLPASQGDAASLAGQLRLELA